jgi:hypothetical protein
MNEKKFEIIFKKMVHLTYIVIFHFKMIIYQNINLPYNYEHHPEKHQFMIWLLSNPSSPIS